MILRISLWRYLAQRQVDIHTHAKRRITNSYYYQDVSPWLARRFPVLHVHVHVPVHIAAF